MSLSQQQLGFHYYPDTDHYSDSDLNTWLPILESTGASWLTLQAKGSKNIPEHFLAALKASGIQPIIHICEPIGSLRMAQVYTALKTYADAGVNYVLFYDRPNMRASWPASTWSHESLISRYVDGLLPILEAQLEMGMLPTLPPLEPGGDYWDTAFLESLLALMQKRVDAAIMDKLTLSIYMWTYGRPVDWGQGGQVAWPDARPYRSPMGSQDQRGFQINEWYQEIARKILGRTLPVLVVGGGAGPSEAYATTEARQLGNNEVARHLAQEGLPEEILNFNFYPLATAENHQDYPAAWYIAPAEKVMPDPSGEHAVVAPLEAQAQKKGIEHYVLLGFSNRMNGLDVWNAIAPPIMSTRATVGFSLEEAKQAVRVSIVGDYDTFPAMIEDQLRANGTETERFEKWDTDEFLLAASTWATKSTATGVEDE